MTVVQPEGVPPASTHHLSAWCAEADLPRNRIQSMPDIQWGWMIAAATNLLYVLSGRKFRSGRSVVRPSTVHPSSIGTPMNYPWSSMSGYGSAWGFAAGWAWSSVGLGFWQGATQDLSQVRLQAPILSINEILLNGAPLTADQYSVVDRRTVVLNQGTGTWPWEQNLILPVSLPGTAQIDYSWGRNPGEEGRLAAAELAIQLGLGFTGSDDCKLPARVLTVATEGVTVAVGDALTFIREDLTGLPLVDYFLRAVNPNRRRRPAAFLGPNSTVLPST